MADKNTWHGKSKITKTSEKITSNILFRPKATRDPSWFPSYNIIQIISETWDKNINHHKQKTQSPKQETQMRNQKTGAPEWFTARQWSRQGPVRTGISRSKKHNTGLPSTKVNRTIWPLGSVLAGLKYCRWLSGAQEWGCGKQSRSAGAWPGECVKEYVCVERQWGRNTPGSRARQGSWQL